jgi:hypothetical protein
MYQQKPFGKEMKIVNGNTRQTKIFIGATMLSAASAAGYATFLSHSLHPYFALTVLALAAVTSRMKVKLPGINGNMSVNLPFLLTAVVNLSAAEAVVIACVSTLVQCWPRKGAKAKPEQLIFNISMMAFASCLASLVLHTELLSRVGSGPNPAGMVLATATLFLAQTVPVAAIVALSEGKAAGAIWWQLAHLSFPYYVVSAGVSSIVHTVSAHMGWELALAVFPVMYGIHRSYRLYFGTMGEGKIAETSHTEVLVKTAKAGA